MLTMNLFLNGSIVWNLLALFPMSFALLIDWIFELALARMIFILLNKDNMVTSNHEMS